MSDIDYEGSQDHPHFKVKKINFYKKKGDWGEEKLNQPFQKKNKWKKKKVK